MEYNLTNKEKWNGSVEEDWFFFFFQVGDYENVYELVEVPIVTLHINTLT